MISKKIDYISLNNDQLIVSRFLNENGEEESGQASVSYGEFNNILYERIHEKLNIKKEKGSSKDSFLEKDNFKNKVKFSFEEGKVLVLTCLVSFDFYSDGTFKEYPFVEGVEDSFFQEKDLKDFEEKNWEFSREQYENLEQESDLEKIGLCLRFIHEVDIPIFGILNGKEIQFVKGPIQGPFFQYYDEAPDVVFENKCEEYFSGQGDVFEGQGNFEGDEEEEEEEEEPNCDPPEPIEGVEPAPLPNFYGFFSFTFGS